jgi:hypothetical protein
MGVFGFVAEILVFGGLVLGGRFSKKELREQIVLVAFVDRLNRLYYVPRNSNDLVILTLFGFHQLFSTALHFPAASSWNHRTAEEERLDYSDLNHQDASPPGRKISIAKSMMVIILK